VSGGIGGHAFFRGNQVGPEYITLGADMISSPAGQHWQHQRELSCFRMGNISDSPQRLEKLEVQTNFAPNGNGEHNICRACRACYKRTHGQDHPQIHQLR
jgi:hypothetical protein